MSILILNGKAANSKPNDQLKVNSYCRTIPPIINGLMPMGVTINSIDRPPVLSGCVLNLPLWHPLLSASTFTSLDTTGASCTVTGAIWTPQGRTFDGDDKIECGASSVFDFGLNSFTYWTWFEGTTLASRAIICKKKDGSPYTGSKLGLTTTGKGTLYTYDNVSGTEEIIGSTTLTDGKFHLLMGIRDMTALRLYLYVDGVSDATPVVITGRNVTIITEQLGIGRSEDGSGLFFTGGIGEVGVANNASSAGDAMRHLQATKWRYN